MRAARLNPVERCAPNNASPIPIGPGCRGNTRPDHIAPPVPGRVARWTLVLQGVAAYTYTSRPVPPLHWFLRRRHHGSGASILPAVRSARSKQGKQRLGHTYRHHFEENPMKNVASIAAITLASGLALIATGCDRTPEEPTPGERMDNAATDTRNAVSGMGDTLDASR